MNRPWWLPGQAPRWMWVIVAFLLVVVVLYLLGIEIQIS